MAANEMYRDGDRISLPVGAGVKSGEPFIIGELVGWAQTDSAEQIGTAGRSAIETSQADGWASCVLVGVFKYPVTATGAATVGTKVYITPGRVLTLAAAGGTNKPFGYLIESIAAAGSPKKGVKVVNGMNA